MTGHNLTVSFSCRQVSTTLIEDDEMADENIRDQFVTTYNLARLLAKDRSFVSEVGLDEFPPDQVVQGLEGIIGFILAMYNAAKNVFSAYRTLTLDERFKRLIYSRFVLYPKFSQRPLTPNIQDELDMDALNYAGECYEEIKRNADQSECKWDDMSLCEKFFEICVRVLIEEHIVDASRLAEEEESQSTNFFHPEDGLFGARPVLAVTFKGVFSHLNWELDENIESTHVSQNEKVVLSPKKGPGPDSRLKEYPLLYLYFDDFSEITEGWSKFYFEAARHDSDIRSCQFSLDQIMNDENLFLELYENELVRLKLWDGTELRHDVEEDYWDRVTHPEKCTGEVSRLRNPELIAHRKRLLKEIGVIVEAIKLRYGLKNSNGD